MTPETFIENAQRLESKMMAQSLLRSTLLNMHEAATSRSDGEAENAYRLKLHTLLDDTLDTSNEFTKLKENFVKSNR